jgi:hypothetical protein
MNILYKYIQLLVALKLTAMVIKSSNKLLVHDNQLN